jgi:hypothetical protein
MMCLNLGALGRAKKGTDSMRPRANTPTTLLIVFALGAIARGQATPSFAGPFSYDPGPTVFGTQVELVDLDGDGREDLVEIANAFPAVMRYRLSNPSGTFGPLFQAPPIALTVARSWNDAGDGTPEFFTFSSAACPAAGIIGFLNDGRGCAAGPGVVLVPFGLPLPCSGSNPAVQ